MKWLSEPSETAAKQLKTAFYKLDKEFWKQKVNGNLTLCMTEGKWLEILKELETECAPFVK